MAREMTPQERAAAIVDKVKSALTPIWLGGRQRMLLEQEIAEALTATRRAALLEAAKLVGDYNCMHNHGKRATKACDDVFDELHRLAQEVA